jgi:GT2 family glycosyltransferase
MLSIPHTEHPRASLVMVTWNAFAWSRRAITSIVEHTSAPYELIIVDNASTDATRAFLRDEVRGATVVLNDRNLGFGAAASLGTKHAHAAVIVFVNSDLMVGPNWLEPLCLRIERDRRVAIAGPAILNLEGKLDHAGGLLSQEGWSIHYGDGDDPERAEYAFARRCDYVTGACLAVRADLFHQSGGFDPWFDTAYFEDTDLCVRLGARGWKVMYEPASRVTHVGSASGTNEWKQRLLAINHPRFYKRWRDLLVRRPDQPLDLRPERVIGARDIMASGTILLIGDGSGAARKLAQSLFELAADLRIALTREHLSGVENVEALSNDWLIKRRFHYDIVAGGDERAFRDTQPAALHVTLESFRRSIASTLIAAGIAPYDSHFA